MEQPGWRRLILARLQERDQVGQLFGRELLLESGGHHGDGPRTDNVDLLARDPDLLVDAGREDDLAGRLLASDARVDAAVDRHDHDRLVAPHEAAVGEGDRLEQVAFGANPPDPRQVGPDLAPQIADRVARGTRRFRAVEHGLTAANVAPGDQLQQLVEPLGLLLHPGRQLHIEGFCLLRDARAELLE